LRILDTNRQPRSARPSGAALRTAARPPPVFVKRPAEAAIGQESGLGPDREGAIFDRLDEMGAWRSDFQHTIWLSISN
jgi:hypothetical protein